MGEQWPVADFATNGFAILDGAVPPEQLAGIRAEGLAVCRGDRGPFDGLLPVPPGTTDDDVLRSYLCIHNPHKISDTLLAVMRQPAVVAALTDVIGPDVKSMQSMFFIKSEHKPGQAWHQDEYFIPTRDRSLTAAWIALDDATTENGCLWVLPGSHRDGVVYPDREQDDDRFDCTDEAYDFPWSDEDAVPVQVPAGSVVLFNGYLLHRSLPNTGRHGFRRAFVSHYMSTHSLLPWGQLPEGVHVGKHDYRDVVLVTGRDPYAYKGTTDIVRPHVRPSGEGGCAR